MIVDTFVNESSPFKDMLQNLNESAEEAEKNWKDSEENHRDSVFQDWCLTGHNMIATRMKTPHDRIEAIRDLIKNFFTTEYSEP